MSPRTLGGDLVHEVPTLRDDEPVGSAVRKILEAKMPALPVCDADGKLCGIFGEREFITAVLPGYVGELRSAAFVPATIDEALAQRPESHDEPISKHMNTEHIDVGPDFSDAQIAETFLHHRVLIIPVVDSRRVVGIVTRSGYFEALAQRLLDQSS